MEAMENNNGALDPYKSSVYYYHSYQSDLNANGKTTTYSILIQGTVIEGKTYIIDALSGNYIIGPVIDLSLLNTLIAPFTSLKVPGAPQ